MEKINTENGVFTNNFETGQTALEVYEEWLLRDLKPSPKEIADAELEIMFLTLLADVGVIQ
ncbi:hypothetical protein [Lysinibacillus fusiformis]|uniref:hypothetical protein n=1 Tax=Lysinibacillus fusiformis TaxID=28031 RepID=UPI00187F160A|nr:hypothetical protein [Lysinibacillus fusiformis]MBD8522338.1 hypothetical protein [Lysinibacillus fusiformis]